MPFPLAASNTLKSLVTDEAIAGYAQATYSLSDALKITGGLRYTHEITGLEQRPGGTDFIKFGRSPESQTVNRLNYQASVQYFINPTAQVYAKVGSSFRSGGFNPGAPPIPGTVAVGGNGFLPESTTAFEVGAKFEGHLGNAPTRLTFAAFSQTVKDVQRAIYATPPGGRLSGFTANIPESRVQGIEVEAFISPAEWLKLGANGTIVDAKFTKATTVAFGVPKTYGPYPDTSKFSGSAYAEVNVPLANDFGNLSLRGDVYHQSLSYISSLNDSTVPGTDLKGYTVANFRLAVEDIGKSGFTIAGYLKNAFNAKYYVGGIPVGEVFGLNSAVPGAPRTWFVEASFKF